MHSTKLLQFFVKGLRQFPLLLQEWNRFLYFQHDLNWFVELIYEQHLVLVVYLNLLQPSYNFLWNKNNLIKNQLCNHLLDQWQFFKNFHVLFYYFLLVDQKFFSINHNVVTVYFNLWKILSFIACSLWIIFKCQSRNSIYSLKI